MDRIVASRFLTVLRSIFLMSAMALAVPAWSADSADLPPININVASAEQLSDGLKGIGPSRAAAIVEYRETHGKFTRVEDLMLVKGIGQRVLDDNRERLSTGQ
ncbi:MAG TPA: ComEA family DNA-binding protein [Spongiibacteraceae bacterium]|jgi:competence protein ComEA|nr:ComEA family DNA-binding protein [Spongiibacteraceae bacterium]HUH37551.1 ComEA family DNA-binding protein [Spongiibacteraceae bacterium]